MKSNILKIFTVAGILIIAATGGAFAANSELCQLITSLKGVFNTLRIMAFVGAAFILMAWAWGWIQAGAIDIKDDARKKMIAMIVGLGILFMVGIMLSFLMNGQIIDCKAELVGKW